MFDAKECLVIHKQDRQVAITGTWCPSYDCHCFDMKTFIE
jgi:hypothetical protein